MMPQITVSQATLDLAGELAEPFIDTTPDSVFHKALLIYKKAKGQTADLPTAENETPSTSSELVFSPDAAPDLSFTRPVVIGLDGQKLEKNESYWNTMFYEMVKRAATKLPPAKLRAALLVNFVEGKGNEAHGYRFIPEAGLSVQGQSANPAWKAILHLAKNTGMKLDVTFVWENKDKAAHPGKTGRMIYDPA